MNRGKSCLPLVEEQLKQNLLVENMSIAPKHQFLKKEIFFTRCPIAREEALEVISFAILCEGQIDVNSNA